jgi:large subunit ribosomal protein L13
MASAAARLLLGKDKPDFTPHVDGGDFVIVINAEKLLVSGDKLAGKQYYRHSGYPSGLTTQTLSEAMEKDVTKVVRHAIRGMLPDNKLRAQRLARLKIYGSSEHQHDAQQPKEFLLAQKGGK